MHERHWVSVHWCRQSSQTPASKVFHSQPQVQNYHLLSLRGDQQHSGQRMREPRSREPAIPQARDPKRRISQRQRLGRIALNLASRSTFRAARLLRIASFFFSRYSSVSYCSTTSF